MMRNAAQTFSGSTARAAWTPKRKMGSRKKENGSLR
jgi:hypothetical protein